MKFLGVTILQGVEFPIFLLIFAWALQQCSATALPVICKDRNLFTTIKVRVCHLRSTLCLRNIDRAYLWPTKNGAIPHEVPEATSSGQMAPVCSERPDLHSPTFHQSQAPFLVTATPSSAIPPDLTKRSQRTRHCDITSIWRSVDYLAASGNVLPAGPAAGGSTISTETTIKPLLQTSGGLPSNVVTVERRYGPRWLRDDDDDFLLDMKFWQFSTFSAIFLLHMCRNGQILYLQFTIWRQI